MLKLFIQGIPIAACMVAGARAQDDTAATTQRFIPIELWTGAGWDGSQQLKMNPAHLWFGNGGQKTIAGPMPWARPSTGETLQVVPAQLAHGNGMFLS